MIIPDMEAMVQMMVLLLLVRLEDMVMPVATEVEASQTMSILVATWKSNKQGLNKTLQRKRLFN